MTDVKLTKAISGFIILKLKVCSLVSFMRLSVLPSQILMIIFTTTFKQARVVPLLFQMWIKQ